MKEYIVLEQLRIDLIEQLKRIADSLEHLCNNTGEEIDRKIDDHVYESHEDE